MNTEKERVEAMVRAARALSEKVNQLTFAEPVTHTYNPLDYAWEGHFQYLQKAAATSKKVLFLGMNPGPWGMAQTGVPFGEIPHVRDWLGINPVIQKPSPEHPKRPIDGFACTRSEVSGKRLWGYFAKTFGAADRFFADHFVANYCPLVFMEETGRNRTPDKLPRAEREPLLAYCDEHLREIVRILSPEWVVGVGGFALVQAERALAEGPKVSLGRVLHPSPASPHANRDWPGTAERQLREQGIW
ncbi:MAG: single-stranded DNA-binding protein [Opitutales bacterium]|nr:single-stranded DNA-binding protein [Opitutales bacterium]